MFVSGDELAIRDRRWSRLEKLRRREEAERAGGASGGDNSTGGGEDDPNGHGDSTESSVEGIFVEGVRFSHPFQVR